MKDYSGMKWKELSDQEKEKMLSAANPVNARTENNMKENGECIIDLIYPFSVPGKVDYNKNDVIIVIEPEAIIYNCEG